MISLLVVSPGGPPDVPTLLDRRNLRQRPPVIPRVAGRPDSSEVSSNWHAGHARGHVGWRPAAWSRRGDDRQRGHVGATTGSAVASGQRPAARSRRGSDRSELPRAYFGFLPIPGHIQDWRGDTGRQSHCRRPKRLGRTCPQHRAAPGWNTALRGGMAPRVFRPATLALAACVRIAQADPLAGRVARRRLPQTCLVGDSLALCSLAATQRPGTYLRCSILAGYARRIRSATYA